MDLSTGDTAASMSMDVSSSCCAAVSGVLAKTSSSISESAGRGAMEAGREPADGNVSVGPPDPAPAVGSADTPSRAGVDSWFAARSQFGDAWCCELGSSDCALDAYGWKSGEVGGRLFGEDESGPSGCGIEASVEMGVPKRYWGAALGATNIDVMGVGATGAGETGAGATGAGGTCPFADAGKGWLSSRNILRVIPDSLFLSLCMGLKNRRVVRS